VRTDPLQLYLGIYPEGDKEPHLPGRWELEPAGALRMGAGEHLTGERKPRRCQSPDRGSFLSTRPRLMGPRRPGGKPLERDTGEGAPME
jgi:hypothetical protein